MLPKGPACTSAGPPSAVCTRLGSSASRRSAVIAPAAPTSPAVTGAPDVDEPTITRERRASRSAWLEARATIAITSLAAVMSKRSCRGTPSRRRPRPSTTLRRARSFMSRARPQVIARASSGPLSPSERPKWQALSAIAESRLCAVVMAWMSPVKWRLMSSAGTSVARPPPVPPPLTPKTGPSEGSRRQRATRLPSRRIPIARPTEVVVLPSPAGVGLIADTRIRRPSPAGARSIAASAASSILALPRPQTTTLSSGSASSRATSTIGCGRYVCVIAGSLARAGKVRGRAEISRSVR